MIDHIFTTPRHCFLGGIALGADYMPGIEAKARRLNRACRFTIQEGLQTTDDRQLKLPFTKEKQG